jgi:hypothetical protein
MRSLIYGILILLFTFQVTARPIIIKVRADTSDTIAQEQQETQATMNMQTALAESEEQDNNMMEKQTTAIDMFDQMMQAIWQVASKISSDSPQR